MKIQWNLQKNLPFAQTLHFFFSLKERCTKKIPYFLHFIASTRSCENLRNDGFGFSEEAFETREENWSVKDAQGIRNVGGRRCDW